MKKSSMKPILSVKNYSKSFSNLQILKDISLETYKGDVVAIIGPSGSGKSTFLRCINLLETPDSGTMRFNGYNVNILSEKNSSKISLPQKDIEKMRSKMGMVFQNFNLWSHLTILENLIEAPIHVLKKKKSEAIETAESLLHKVGIYEKRHQYPHQLSGGQQQRAGIARALAMEPELLLFDEPTSALDPETVGEVLKVIEQIAKDGYSMIIVSHEISFVENVANKVYFFDEGEVKEQGSNDIIKNPKSPRMKQFLKRHRN